MPVLPTIASICGIISCFQSAGSLFTAVNSRKEATRRYKDLQAEKEEAKAAEKASKALTVGKSDVQSEYDRNFARIGPQYATGDQTGCMQLMSELLQMQREVIGVLHSALTGGQLDVNKLALAADSRTDNTISVLNDQFQRMSVNAPIRRPIKPRALPLRRPQLCQEAQRLLACPSSTPRYKTRLMLPDPEDPTKVARECSSCSSTWNDRPVGLIKDPVSKLRYPSDFQFRCHTPVDNLYLCYICGPDYESPVMDGHAELMAHLRTHSQSDLMRPARVNSPAPVSSDSYENNWMPKGWKGGYVEEQSLPNTPMPTPQKGGGHMNVMADIPPPPIGDFRKVGHLRNVSAPSPSWRGVKNGGHTDGDEGPFLSPGRSGKGGGGYMGGKSAPPSPTTGSFKGGNIDRKPTPPPPQGRHRRVCGAG